MHDIIVSLNTADSSKWYIGCYNHGIVVSLNTADSNKVYIGSPETKLFCSATDFSNISVLVTLASTLSLSLSRRRPSFFFLKKKVTKASITIFRKFHGLIIHVRYVLPLSSPCILKDND